MASYLHIKSPWPNALFWLCFWQLHFRFQVQDPSLPVNNLVFDLILVPQNVIFKSTALLMEFVHWYKNSARIWWHVKSEYSYMTWLKKLGCYHSWVTLSDIFNLWVTLLFSYLSPMLRKPASSDCSTTIHFPRTVDKEILFFSFFNLRHWWNYLYKCCFSNKWFLVSLGFIFHALFRKF